MFSVRWKADGYCQLRAALRLVRDRVLCQIRAPYRPVTSLPHLPIAGPKTAGPGAAAPPLMRHWPSLSHWTTNLHGNTVITGPPIRPVLFCSLASVTLSRRAGRVSGRQCTADQYGYAPLGQHLAIVIPGSVVSGGVGFMGMIGGSVKAVQWSRFWRRAALRRTVRTMHHHAYRVINSLLCYANARSVSQSSCSNFLSRVQHAPTVALINCPAADKCWLFGCLSLTYAHHWNVGLQLNS